MNGTEERELYPRGSGYEHVADCCEDGNESSGSIK
jgi:hypothetical protein